MKKILLTGLSAIMGVMCAQAAAPRPFSADADPLRHALGARTMASAWSPAGAASGPARIAPDQSLSSNELLFIDGPDGTTWYATVAYDIEEVALPGGIATQKNITGFSYTIYNDAFEQIGTVSDKIVLDEGESRVAQIMLGYTVTKKFFNTDNKPEVTVTLAMNKADLTNYPYVNIRTNVYSVGGQKTEEGYDAILQTIPGMPVASVNAASDAWSEDFYLSYLSESCGDVDDYDDYLEYLASMKSVVTTYKKASWNGAPSVLDVFEICQLNLPGDSMNNPYFISCIKDGKLTFITSQYEKSFFVDPTGMGGNEEITPDNHLIVKVRQLPSNYTTEFNEIASLTIPTVQNAGGDVLCTFYSVGSLMYDGDVDFGNYNADGSPAFVITAADYSAVNDDQYYESYYVYNSAGERIATLAENTESYVLMQDIPGAEPQAMFIYPNGDSYVYDFVNLYSGESVMSISNIVEGRTVSSAIERVATANGVLYGTSLNSAFTGEDGNTYHEIGWLNTSGAFDRIDCVNLGKNVAIAQVYIGADALSPYLFNTDTVQEYMFLVKRYLQTGSSETQEELMVVAPGSEPILSILPDAQKGNLASVGVIPGETPRLAVCYQSGSGDYTADFYSLPLVKFAGGTGTAEDPYLIASIGDLQQIKTAPAAYYILTADIDGTGFEFSSIADFTGTLNGNGKTVSNLTVTGRGIFKETSTGAVVKNITFTDPVVNPQGSTFSYTGLIAGEAQGTTFENITVYGLKAFSDDFDDQFGTIVGRATAFTTVKGCNVAGAIINFPGTSAAGLVGDILTGTTVQACAFTGSITGGSEVGGIASSIHTDGGISDCHVDANLTAVHTIGGVVASSRRGPVTRNHVEGTITATGATPWRGHCVGGVVGYLEGDYAEAGDVAVSANFVGHESITVDPTALGTPSYPSQFDTAHRIIGWSKGNNEPDIIGYDEDWNPVYSTEPIDPEAGLADNYVLSDIETITGLEDAHNGLEGAAKSRWELEQEWMEGLGYKFGTDSDNPWNLAVIYSPKLHFETAAVIETALINTHVGDNFNIAVRLINRDEVTLDDVMGDFTFDYDYTKIEMTGMASVENNVLYIEMTALQTGTSTFRVSVFGSSVAGTVEVATSGIADIVADTDAIAIRYTGTEVSARGCDIEIYTLAGIKVAAGTDTVSTAGLGAGAYIVRATAAGASKSIKIMI